MVMDPTLPRVSVRDLLMQAFLTGWELSDKTVSQDEYLQSSIQVIEMLQVEPENLYAEEGLGLPDGEEVDHLDSKLTFFRLLPDAPNNLSVFFLSSAVRFFGISIFSAPDKNLPVNEFGFCMMCCAVPSAMTLPPCTPAPGPMSIIWSALKIASSSCSTTITVLPRFRK